MRLEHGEAHRLANQVMQSLSERGLKPDSQSKLEGVLEATKYHLEDMRRIVDVQIGLAQVKP